MALQYGVVGFCCSPMNFHELIIHVQAAAYMHPLMLPHLGFNSLHDYFEH